MVGNGVGAKKVFFLRMQHPLKLQVKPRLLHLIKQELLQLESLRLLLLLLKKKQMKKELLGIAIGLESKSEHPLAKAITSYAKENNIKPYEIVNFKSEVGNGLVGEYNGSKVLRK